MIVTKRNGSQENLNIDKIHQACEWACEGLNVSQSDLESSAHIQFYSGITTGEIQVALIKSAFDKFSPSEFDWTYVAARLLLQRLYKEVNGGSIEYRNIKEYLEEMVADGTLDPELLTRFDLEAINNAIDPSRDHLFQYTGLQIFYDRYLVRNQAGKIRELPQHLWMRIALGIALAEKENPTERAIEFYNVLSNFEFVSSTPTLFNSGTTRPQMSSCFLMTMGDGLDEIFDTLREAAQYSKFSGGNGIDITPIRAAGSYIKGTGGKAGGIVPYAKLINDTMIGFDQGGRRKGSAAVYLEPWHSDILAFLDLKKTSGDDRRRAHDIFPALWIPDLFMERVENQEMWSIFSPSVVPELHDLYGEEFNQAYLKAEEEGLYSAQIPAVELWKKIVMGLYETGTYWPCFKDEINRRHNQQGSGVVHSSNLCVAPETLILTDKGHEVISELVGQKVNVWNGEEFSEVEVFKTGENQKLMLVTLDDGAYLNCTPYHKWYIQEGTTIVEKRTEELNVGDKVIPLTMPLTHEGFEVIPAREVLSITDEGRVDDTYCFTEPKRHMGVFNGILTGQCTEITLRTDSKTSAVCNLGSINLSRVTNQTLPSVVKTAIRMLDNVIEIGLIPHENGKRFNLEERAIGMGIMGYTEYLIINDVDFESQEHLDLANDLMGRISYYAISASCDLAEERGAYPLFSESLWAQGILPVDTAKEASLELVTSSGPDLDWEALRARVRTGIRNSHLLAIAPTATISNIVGTTPATELPLEEEYTKANLSGDFTFVHPSIKYGKPELCKVMLGVDMKWAVKAAAVRQRWIDQSQSTNLFITEEIKGRDISDLYFLGWKYGMKTFYYLKNQSAKRKESKKEEVVEESELPVMCSIDNPDCESCQ